MNKIILRILAIIPNYTVEYDLKVCWNRYGRITEDTVRYNELIREDLTK